MIDKDSGDFVTSIARSMEVLLAFDQENAEMTPADVARKTKLDRATARRMLLTLNALGYVATDGKWYRLTPKILDLSFSYLTSMKVAPVIQPVINEVSKKIEETCTVSVMQGHEVISIAHTVIAHYGRVTYYPGARFPAYISSAGRVFMADMDEDELDGMLSVMKLEVRTPKTITSPELLKKELEKVRKQGFAYVDGELELGLFTLAAPIRNDVKKAIAAVTLGGNVAKINRDNIEEKFLPELFSAAEQISRLLPDRHHIM